MKYLESVQSAWKDPKKKVVPDQSVLLNLARLYETDHPEKSLKCLEEVEQMEIEAIPEEDYPEGVEEGAELTAALRQLLPPQLLNNMGCFHFQAERYVRAQELFQVALNACVNAENRDDTIDTDALVTSISFNLARTYEAEGQAEEAKKVYNSLLQRHPDYVDARIRLTYIALRENPQDEGPRAMKDLFKENEDNVEVRALYGWYVNKSKKKTSNFAADNEQRLYKHTLQKSDKHDRYSLMGMGNIHLAIAREMPRSSEQDKEKRRKSYRTSCGVLRQGASTRSEECVCCSGYCHRASRRQEGLLHSPADLLQGQRNTQGSQCLCQLGTYVLRDKAVCASN